MSDRNEKAPFAGRISRRNFLGTGSAALAGAAALGASAYAQSRQTTEQGLKDHSFSNPGPDNAVLGRLNPNSNIPPPTDHGTVQPFWYSFNLTHKRVQEGGWTNQVTQRELPTSTDVAGVRMRLTAGSYRELHWHTADEWAFMFYGNARVTVLNPDGTVFIGDVTQGDLWFFPSGFPHSIQGLGPDGCEFLLVFDEGMFSEESTFLLSDWVSHVPPEVLSKNFGLGESAIAKLPTHPLYIFPGQVPPSLEQDIAAAGGNAAQSPINYTFKMAAMPPTKTTPGGEVRVVDSHNFPASKSIAAGLVRVKPGGMRELHWHPNANEWQFYISGKGRMTVFAAQSDAHTMDFNEADVGFVPKSAGHYIENTGNTDLVFLEIFKTSEFQDVSLNNWLRHLPPELVTAHLGLDAADISKIPAAKQEVLAG
jgi:oxalate decarboxylase